MYQDLTAGPIGRSLICFALPMIAGNLLQQLYNIADTLIVGRVLGSGALAAVGSAYTLMTFLTSIFLGLSMGAGALYSICLGQGDAQRLRLGVFHGAVLIFAATLAVNLLVYLGLDGILWFLRVPENVLPGMRAYLLVIFGGILATSIYNFCACLLRAVGNSVVPLVFLAVSAVGNIVLDLLFVAVLPWGITGAAAATVISQYASGIGIAIYVAKKTPELLPKRGEMKLQKAVFREIGSLSALTCLQQSVMNFGILMVQGLVNSFGTVIMAAFAAAVKIDTFAYLPVQDFGNAFSTFVAQNYGAGQRERIRKGTRTALGLTIVFSMVISGLVCLFAGPLIAAGVTYLRIEGACYFGIGILFLLYGYYRAIKKPGMSVVLTVISLGTRVGLAYGTAGMIGVTGIWLAIPIGWALADAVGLIWMKLRPLPESIEA
jgi:putative MATE family efflux protein